MTQEAINSSPGVAPPEEIAGMTTTTAPSNQYPDVPLPAGALADCESWAFWDNEFRIFHGADRIIRAEDEIVAKVQTGGVQLPDGSVDLSDPPRIDLFTFSDDGMTSDQARELAAALLEAAAEIDRWAER
jgi:hypothetical protein